MDAYTADRTSIGCWPVSLLLQVNERVLGTVLLHGQARLLRIKAGFFGRHLRAIELRRAKPTRCHGECRYGL